MKVSPTSPVTTQRKKVVIECLRGDKTLNNFYRNLDIGGEGVFVKERMTATLKPGVQVNKEWKEKFIAKMEEFGEKEDFEVRDFKFWEEI